MEKMMVMTDHPNLQQQLSSKQRSNKNVPTVHIVTTDLNQQHMQVSEFVCV
jgi:hypothetical protein